MKLSYVLFIWVAIQFVSWFELSISLNITEYSYELRNRIPRREYYQFTKQFTHYYMYFGVNDRCFDSNKTHLLIENHVNVCPRFINHIKLLKKDDVTWKAKKNANENNTVPLNKATEDDAHQIDEKDHHRHRIHEHLIFLIILPNHPFSSELYKSVLITQQLFPSITVIAGYANEFHELCNRYLLNSFPKLIYFDKGRFISAYEGDYQVHNVAAQISKWTMLIPSSFPLYHLDYEPRKVPSFIRKDLLWPLNATLGIPVNSSFQVPFPYPNMEPFLGSVSKPSHWEHSLFLFSGIYILLRLAFLFSSIDTPR